MLVGTCQEMCPKDELLEHETVLISDFEKDAHTGKFVPELAIKKFHRSDAGKKINESSIRPLPVLVKTMDHIINFVLGKRMNTSETTTEIQALNFASDRIRAIQMDITLQNIIDVDALKILEKSVLLLIWGRAKFEDPSWYMKFNHVQTMEQITQNLITIEEQLQRLNEEDRLYECEFYALHLLVHISYPHFITQINRLPSRILNSKPVSWVLSLRKCVLENNMEGYMKVAKKMPIQFEIFALQNMRNFPEQSLRSLRYMGKHRFSPSLVHHMLKIPSKYILEYQKSFGIVEEQTGLIFKHQVMPIDRTIPDFIIPEDTLQMFNSISVTDFLDLRNLEVRI